MNFKKQIIEYKDDLIKTTQNLIRIRSVQEPPLPNMPYGKGMNDALGYVLELAEDMGFTVKNLDGYCGYIEYGEGDLYIGVLSHVDTYPEGDMWVIPPFEGRIMNNRIYGRGAMDNKGPLIASLFALKAVKDSGKKLNKKIRLIIGTDEERYYRDMEHYLANEKPPITGFTLDGQFPVVFAEKGLAMLEFSCDFKQSDNEYIAYIKGGTADNTVPGYCEALIITERKSEIIKKLSVFTKENRHNMQTRLQENGVIIESYGVETHSMALELGINAISQMIKFLFHIGIGDTWVRQMICFLENYLSFDIYGNAMGINYEDEFSGKLTVNFGIFDFDGENSTIRLDIRYPVTCDFEGTSKKIKTLFENNGFIQTENTYWDPIYFPQNHFLIKALLKAYREVTKDNSEPISSGSGSYSKVIPNVAAFGAIFPGESEAWHQKNEYIDIDNLVKMCEIYATAIYELGSL